LLVSYAQNAEDVLIDRFFGGKIFGSYIDVGAARPDVNSVTKHFYDMGWSGLNIEPVESAFALLERDRPRDTNLKLAVSNVVGTRTLYEIPSNQEISSLDREAADDARNRHDVAAIEREVEVSTLAAICEEHGIHAYDFLKVDVEGHELEVLSGVDLIHHRPELIVVESTRPETSAPSHEAWEPMVIDAGYRFAFYDGLNRYYVASEHADRLPRLQVPANPSDHFVTPKLLMLREPEVKVALKVRRFLLRYPRLRRRLFASLRRHPSRSEERSKIIHLAADEVADEEVPR